MPWLIGLCSAGLYAFFLTHQYAGDGLRHLAAITGSWPPEPGGTNHLLFPLVGWLWFQLIGQLLPTTFLVTAIQMMNAIFAGWAVGLGVAILQKWGVTTRSILLAVISLIFASAFWPSATDMVEVMPSIPLILLPFWLLSSPEPPGWARIAGAALSLALATAIYQASLFSGLGLAALVWLRSDSEHNRGLGKIVGFGAITFGILGVIYPVAFILLGEAESISEAIRISLATESPYAYGYFDPKHIAGAVAGWVTAWIGLYDFQGLTIMLAGLRQGQIFPDGINLGLMGVQYGLFLLLLTAVWRGQGRLFQRREKRQLAAVLGLWFLPHFLFLIYWIPAYDKLWIPPLIAIIFFLALLLDELSGIATSYQKVGWTAAIILCILVVMLNLTTGLWPSRFGPNDSLEDAQEIAEVHVKSEDLVITDGWGPTAVYFEHFTDREWVGFAHLALANPGQSTVVAAKFEDEMENTTAGGGDVYFLGVLDLTETEWQPLFGDRFGMAYEDFASFRERAEPVMALNETTNRGRPLHLWRVQQAVTINQ